MMSDRKTRIVNKFGQDHPALGSYLECVSRGYLTGLAGFSLSFACTYSAQRLTAHRLPYTANGHLLLAGVVATAVAYKVTADQIKHCHNFWMAAEDKHTALNPIHERVNHQGLEKEA